MSNKITLKKSSVGDKVPLPGDLEYGELALNYTDGNLFYKNSSNVITTIASNKFLSVTGNVTADYFIGDGSQLTNVQAGTVSIFITGGSMGTITAPVTEEEDLGQVSVESTQNLTLGTLLVDGLVDNSSIIDGVITGNKLSSDINIVTTGNISAGYFIGNGSQLTGLPASYSNIDAANYGEAGWAGNIVPAANSVYSLGNSTRQWADLWVSNNTIYLGGVSLAVDGNTLTVAGVPMMSNNGTSSISTTGNVSAGYFVGNGSLLTGLPESYTNANVATYLASGNISSNIITSGNVTGLVFIGSAVGLTSIPGANVTGTVANATYASSANSAETANTANTATSATTAGTVTTAAQGNITSVGTLTSLSVTGNVQGGNLRTNGLISSAGNVIGANINTAGQVSAVGNVVGGGITLSGNTIFSTGSTLTIDPSAVGVTGTVVIAGNLTVQGSTTTYDSTTVTINDLLFSVANNAATASAANGGGLEVGPAGSPYATWTYDQPNSRWTTALGMNAAGNVLGGNVLTSGLMSATGAVTGSQFNGSGAGLSSIPGANVTGTVANATYATSAGSATTAGTVTTAAQGNITSVGTLTSLSVSGNIVTSGTFSGNGLGITAVNASNISSGTLAQARLANSSLTVNGTAIALGSSGTVTANTPNAVTFNNGGSGAASGTTFNGGSAVTVSYNTVGAPSTTGTNASGTWGISITGSAGSATTATNQSGGTVSATTIASSGRYTRSTTAGINSPSARFALTTGQQADWHIASSVNGSSPTNTQQYGLTFSPAGGSTQAGILISENGSDGTAIGFFCTNSYAAGPQLRGSFDPSGNFTAAQNVTAYSDERLKKDWVPLPSNFVEKLAKVKNGIFTRTDLGTEQVGVSAQSLQQLLPQAVIVDQNGILSVAYGHAALTSTVELAKEIVSLKDKVARLEALIEKLIGE